METISKLQRFFRFRRRVLQRAWYCLLFSVSSLYAEDASSVFFDTAFGNEGLVRIENGIYIEKLLIDSENRILCLSSQGYQDYALVRCLGDGQPDVAFGENGVVRGVIRAYDFSVCPDGKILVLGKDRIERFHENGIPDSGFGNNGVLSFQGPAQNIRLLLLDDGKFLRLDYLLAIVSGSVKEVSAIYKHNADGTSDQAFGVDGKVVVSDLFDNDGSYIDFTVLKDGAIVCGGRSIIESSCPPLSSNNKNDSRFSLVKLNADGSLATAFGDGGRFDINLSTRCDEMPAYSFEACEYVKELENGQIVAGGITDSFDSVILKLNADGTLDTAFGADGVCTLRHAAFDSAFPAASKAEIDKYQKCILVLGSTDNNDLIDFYVTCYDITDGSIYSDDRINMFPFLLKDDNSGFSINSIKMQPDGKLLLGGRAESDFGLWRIKFAGHHPISVFQPDTPAAALSVLPQASGIVIQGVAQGEIITVHNTAGILVTTAAAGENRTYIPLPGKGPYIIKVSGEGVKVVL